MFHAQQAEMDVDQVAEAEPEDEGPTKMEIGEVPQAEQAETSAAPAPAVVATPPTTTSNAARETVLSTATAPLLHMHSSSIPSVPTKPAAPPFGRTVERSTPAPAVVNPTQNTLFVSPPSSTGFPQRSPVPVQPGAGLNTSGRQPQPGNHVKSNNQPTAPPSQSPAGSSVGNRAGPVNPSAGPASVFSVGSGSGILPRPSVGPILPPVRPGSGPAAGPASHPARPAAPASNRFPPTTSPVANPGEPAVPGQGHSDISNRKVVLQGVPQTP